jgi:O-antigen ligase
MEQIISYIKKLSIREHAFLALVLIFPLIFHPATGDIEFIKTTVLAMAAVTFFLSKPLVEVKNKALGYSLTALAAASILSTIVAYGPNLAMFGSYSRGFGLVTWLAGILLALTSCQIFTDKKLQNNLLQILSISGLIAAITALILFWFLDINFEGRISGTLGNPNVLGKLLLVSIIAGFHQIKTTKNNYLWTAITSTQVAAILATGNRGAWLALIITALIYFVPKERGHLKKLFASLAVILGSISVLFWERISSLDSIQTRLELLWAGTKAFIERPFFGYGFDHIEYALDLPHYTLLPDRTHQMFLDAGLTTGVFGMLALAALSVIATLTLLKSKQSSLRTAGFALLALLISLQFSFFTSMSFFLFWVLIGLALSQKSPLRFLRS